MSRFTRPARAMVACLLLSASPAGAQTSIAIERGRGQFEAGRYGESAKTLEALVARRPQDASAHYWLGRARLELHDYPRAIDAFRRAVELRPLDSEYHRWLGRAYGEEANREHSFSLARHVREQFEEAVRLEASNVAARRDLLQFYLEAPWILGGGEDKAWRQAEAIAAIDPIAGHLARAAYWIHRDGADHTARAKAEHEAVLAAMPTEVDPYLEVAEYYEKRNDASGLRETLEGLTGVDPTAPELLYLRGVLNVIAGVKPEEAESSLNMYLSAAPARSHRPSPASAHEWLGRLYESLGQSAQAAAEYRNALDLDPDRKHARESLRRLSQRRGR